MITGLRPDATARSYCRASPSSQDGGLLISRRLVVRHRGITFNTSPNSPVFESEAHCDSLDYLSVLAERQMRHRFHYCLAAQRCRGPERHSPCPWRSGLVTTIQGHPNRPFSSSVNSTCAKPTSSPRNVIKVVDSRIRVIKYDLTTASWSYGRFSQTAVPLKAAATHCACRPQPRTRSDHVTCKGWVIARPLGTRSSTQTRSN